MPATPSPRNTRPNPMPPSKAGRLPPTKPGSTSQFAGPKASSARVRQSRGRNHPPGKAGVGAAGDILPPGSPGSKGSGLRLLYTEDIGKMMFTHGDSRKTDPEVSALMEVVIREEMVKLVKSAAEVTRNRGSTTMNVSDVAFVIRHDKSKLKRLLEFLGWKEVRQKVAAEDQTKDGTEAEGEQAECEVPEELAGATTTPLASLKMPWDFLAELSRVTGSTVTVDQFTLANPNDEDVHLRKETADRLTKTMSKGAYIDYTECRQASFTYKKSKKFREWMDNWSFIEFSPNADVTEVFGYLAWEIVAHITECALKIKTCVSEQAAERARQENNEIEALRIEEELASPKPLNTNQIYEALRRIRAPRKASSIFSTTRRRR